MYSSDEYKKLTLKYGSVSSWAIWNYDNAYDTSIIDQQYDKLHSKFVLLGLNVSRILDSGHWSNFHDNTHARKLKYACNDTKLRGSYITDIFKGIDEPSSAKLEESLTGKIISKNVYTFKQEMRDIKLRDDSQFIIFGNLTGKYFDKYFASDYKNKIICVRHYSSRGTDQEWINGFWEKLNIKQNW